MATKELICTSCKRRITNLVGSINFKCPNCGNSEIVRCNHCREISARYKCVSCDFTGPN